MRFLITLLALLAVAKAVELPSCEADTDAHCVGEGQDLSPEGIKACLEALASPSERCSNFMKLMTACASDISSDGVCGSAHMDGETMPCLVQRTKPEMLSAECAAALPKDDLKGLAKYWVDGKRILDINEISNLNAEDKDLYNRWKKRKGGAKSAKDKERAYAIKTQKKEMAVKQVTEAVAARLAGGELSKERALKFAKSESKEAVDTDMTGTLNAFSKGELATIASEAIKLAKATKSEL